MAEGITIDDFPIETSIQWAKGQDYIKHIHEVRDALSVLHRTEITVAMPTYDHLTLLFEQNKKAPPLASFLPPPHFHHQSNRFFNQALIPGIDPVLLIETYQTELESLHTLNIPLCPQSSEQLLTLLETLETLNILLAEMRTKILQHRKA